MEALAVAALFWAAEGSAPLASLGALVAVVTTAVGSALGVAAYRTSKSAARRQSEIDGVKIGMEFVTQSLARADTEIAELSTRLVATQAELTTTKAALGKAQDDIELVRLDLSEERRRNADRVKVLVRQIRHLGGNPESEG